MSQTDQNTPKTTTFQLVSPQTRQMLSLKTVLTSTLLLLIPIVAFSIIQYIRYGFGLFLGWDTSTYVWWAEEVYLYGALSLILQGFPNLYILSLAAMGILVGSASLAERILPFIVSAPLGYAYYRFGVEVTLSRRLGYIGALLGGLSVNTLRLFSDLNRNMLSFGLIMMIGVLMSAELKPGKFSWRVMKRKAFLLWLPLLAVAAYTQVETYAVLMLTMFLLFVWYRNSRNIVLGSLFIAMPIIVSLPLTWSFLLNYQSGLNLLGLPAPTPSFALANSVVFLGGLALPWTLLGLTSLIRKARIGNPSARFLVLWLLSLLMLSPVSLVLGLPIIRLLFVVPVPALSVAGIMPSVRYGSILSRAISKRLHVASRGRVQIRPSASMIIIILLVASTFLTSAVSADTFLRPYVAGSDIDRLVEASRLVQELGYRQPILVMYGSQAADLNSIYRAYFSIQIPDSLAYYGKLQYLFTLPSPGQVYQFQFDPSYEQASALKYRSEILAKLGSTSEVASHPIVIAGGSTYDRPLSELFVSKFQVAPGIYIIPARQLSPVQIDSWRLFAYSDWTTTTTTQTSNATWALSPNSKTLELVTEIPGRQFQANYTIDLAQSWSSMQLNLHYFDWPSPYIFPDSSSATLAPLNVYLDNKLVVTQPYTGQGPSLINETLPNVRAGLHYITISSMQPSMPTAVALDYLAICPIQCS